MPVSSDELAAFLTHHNRAFLFTLRADGSPTAHPLTALPANGRVVFNTYRKSAKVRNTERDSRACAVILNGYAAPSVEGVVIQGRAHLPAHTRLTRSGPGGSAPNVAGSVVERVSARLASGKRVLLEVEPRETAPLRPLRRGS